jgi:hypothetical protein
LSTLAEIFCRLLRAMVIFSVAFTMPYHSDYMVLGMGRARAVCPNVALQTRRLGVHYPCPAHRTY